MSADPIQDCIVSTLAGLGYTAIPNMEPTVSGWETIPAVRVCRLSKNDVKFMGMGQGGGTLAKRNVTQPYECVYIAASPLNPLPPDAVATFKQNLINSFMGANSALLRVPGVWQSRVTDSTEFRRDLLPANYTYSAMLVNVDYIQNP